MRSKFLALALLLSSCVEVDAAIIRRAAIRNAAGTKLLNCIRNTTIPETCRAENYAWCLSQGLEKTCGIDDAWYQSLTPAWYRRRPLGY